MKWVVGGDTLQKGGQGPCSLAWKKGALRERVGRGVVCHKQAPEQEESWSWGEGGKNGAARGTDTACQAAVGDCHPLSVSQSGGHLTAEALGRERSVLPLRP